MDLMQDLRRTCYCGEVTKAGETVVVGGFVQKVRNLGNLIFIDLRDRTGIVQLAFNDQTDRAIFEKATSCHSEYVLMAKGVVAERSSVNKEMKTGAFEVLVDDLRVLSKAQTPPFAITDETKTNEELRLKYRYLDLRRAPLQHNLIMRHKIALAAREYFYANNFIEIETPMLQNLHGGAAARPFSTHMNAYDTELFLRIAPELFLKRAVVGGVDKVFEINRNFRNEGADSSHSPEFTMLEAYEAYGSYDTMARRTREFIQKAARDALGTEIVTLPDGSSYDLSGSWKEISMFEATAEALGREFTVNTPLAELVKIAEELGEDVADHWGPGKVAEVIFEVAVGDKLYAPTFVRDYPEDSSPLTRGHRSKPGIVEKWDLYVRGFELATRSSSASVSKRRRLLRQRVTRKQWSWMKIS